MSDCPMDQNENESEGEDGHGSLIFTTNELMAGGYQPIVRVEHSLMTRTLALYLAFFHRATDDVLAVEALQVRKEPRALSGMTRQFERPVCHFRDHFAGAAGSAGVRGEATGTSDAQLLMDDLWRAGVRPSAYLAGETPTSAYLEHIKDLRQTRDQMYSLARGANTAGGEA